MCSFFSLYLIPPALKTSLYFQYLVVETLRELGYSVGATGDGVNDAPALKHADVGIAVKGATDAANAAADIVLTDDGLSTIVYGIVVAREIFARISNFITYRVSVHHFSLSLCVFLARSLTILLSTNIRYQQHSNCLFSSSLQSFLSIHTHTSQKLRIALSFSSCPY